MTNLLVTCGSTTVEIQARGTTPESYAVGGRVFKQQSVALMAAFGLAKRQESQRSRITNTATSGLRRFCLI